MSTTMLTRSSSFARDHYESESCQSNRRREDTSAAEHDSIPMRFARSMIIDLDKWRNAIGYDLELIREATMQERNAIERLLLGLGVNDWRDVEALAALATSRAKEALLSAFKNPQLRGAVAYYAPALVAQTK
jgi:hypothetical protein